MKTKTLLVGSAAALLVTGGAQAADFSIAESVEYVRVCDAFGVGYWYIPGTDTCIKIGGFVQFDLKFQSAGWEFDDGTQTHSSRWNFVTEAGVNFTAKSMTEYGALVGYVAFKGVWDGVDGGGEVEVDEAYLSLGHILFGYGESPQNTDGGWAPGAYHPDTSTNLIALSWAVGGFGLMLGIEDPRTRWGTELPVLSDAYSMPDLTAAMTIAHEDWDAKVSAGWSELMDGSVYGVSGTITASVDPFEVRVGGSFGTGSSYLGDADIFDNYDQNWTAFISAIWAMSTLEASSTYAYAANSTDGNSETAFGAKLEWKPVSGFSSYLEGKAWKTSYGSEHDWEAKFGVLHEF